MSMALVFEAAFDLAEVGALELAVVETGGSTFNVDLDTGEFFLTVDGSALVDGDYFEDIVSPIGSLLAALKTALEAGGAAAYAVTYDDETERVTIAASGGGVTAVSITPSGAAATLIGLTSALSGALSHTCQIAPSYTIAAASGHEGPGWTGEYEGGDDVAYDVEAHDGRPGGAAKEDAPTYLDFDLPLEPVERVGNMRGHVDPSAPWTWAHFWKHCRNVNPFCIRNETGLTYALMLRAEGARFRPRALGQGYVARWDLDFQTRVLARKDGS